MISQEKQVYQTPGFLKETISADQQSVKQQAFGRIKQGIIIFERIKQTMKANPKMDKYFHRIDITKDDVYNTFDLIIELMNNLFKKIDENIRVAGQINFAVKELISFLTSEDFKEKDTKQQVVWILEIQSKVYPSLKLMIDFKDYSDITNSPRQNYKEVWDKIKIVKAKNPQKVAKQYKSLKTMLHITTSAVISQQSHDIGFIKKLSFGLSIPKYFIMRDSAKLRSFKLYRSPQINLSQKMWNLSENGAIRQLSKINFESIKTNKKIYIPFSGKVEKGFNIFEQEEKAITIRILSNQKLNISKEKDYAYFGKDQDKRIDTMMIHLHGGGFIAMSSRSMQIYTRKWANQLKIPVFSVDYRMPPDHPYPQAPMDCLTAYKFIINHIHQYFNIDPKNIYIGGDSAGGNLTCAVTALILKNKLPEPKGLYLAYPAIDLRYRFSLSKIYALNDPLLWPPSLLLCLNSYLSNQFEKSNDPIVSPVLVTEKYINGTGQDIFPRNWPTTYISVGMKDSLFDDSLILMQKMVESKVDCYCIAYEDFSHGFLNTDKFIDETDQTITDSIKLIKQLIKSTKEKQEKI